MPSLVQDERIYETSVTTGTGEYTLAGAATGFQPASVIAANNYLVGFVTDDVNWEAGLYTYVSGPDRLQRTHVVASSNGDAAVNWGAGTKKLRCGPLAFFERRQVSKSVAGSSNVTLTALEQYCDQLILTGLLTGNINVIVDTTKQRWSIFNNTTGAYTVTFKTSAGTGIVIAQGGRALLECDGTNIINTGGNIVMRSYLAGCVLSTLGASATMSIAAGVAVNSTNAAAMVLSAIGKTTAAWAAGTAQGGLDTGTIANSTWYKFYVIQRVDTGVVDVIFTVAALETGPAMPAGYTLFRYIGSGLTNGSAQWTVASQQGDEFVLSVPPNNIDSTSVSSTAASLVVTTPLGVKCIAHMQGTMTFVGSSGVGVLISSLDSSDVAPVLATGKVTYANSVDGQYVSGNVSVRTNTSSEIRIRATNNSTYLKLNCLGWTDTRGRDL